MNKSMITEGLTVFRLKLHALKTTISVPSKNIIVVLSLMIGTIANGRLPVAIGIMDAVIT